MMKKFRILPFVLLVGLAAATTASFAIKNPAGGGSLGLNLTNGHQQSITLGASPAGIAAGGGGTLQTSLLNVSNGPSQNISLSSGGVSLQNGGQTLQLKTPQFGWGKPVQTGG